MSTSNKVVLNIYSKDRVAGKTSDFMVNFGNNGIDAPKSVSLLSVELANTFYNITGDSNSINMQVRDLRNIQILRFRIRLWYLQNVPLWRNDWVLFNPTDIRSWGFENEADLSQVPYYDLEVEYKAPSGNMTRTGIINGLNAAANAQLKAVVPDNILNGAQFIVYDAPNGISDNKTPQIWFCIDDYTRNQKYKSSLRFAYAIYDTDNGGMLYQDGFKAIGLDNVFDGDVAPKPLTYQTVLNYMIRPYKNVDLVSNTVGPTYALNVLIKSGNYNINTIKDGINSALATAVANSGLNHNNNTVIPVIFDVGFDPTEPLKGTFYVPTDDRETPQFGFMLTGGSLMNKIGFSENKFNHWATVITGDSIVDMRPVNTIQVVSNGLIPTNTVDSKGKTWAMLTKLQNNEKFGSTIFYKSYHPDLERYNVTKNISDIRIHLIDEDGRPLDNNGVEWSLSVIIYF